MDISNLIDEKGLTFWDKTGVRLDGEKYYAVADPKIAVISFDVFKSESIPSLATFLEMNAKRKQGFVFYENKVGRIEGQPVDFLEKDGNNLNVTKGLCSARDEFSYFDVENVTEIKNQ